MINLTAASERYDDASHAPLSFDAMVGVLLQATANIGVDVEESPEEYRRDVIGAYLVGMATHLTGIVEVQESAGSKPVAGQVTSRQISYEELRHEEAYVVHEQFDGDDPEAASQVEGAIRDVDVVVLDTIVDLINLTAADRQK